jgi:hypothetical protein
MPLDDFHCEQCETKFEVRASIKEKQAGLAAGMPDVPQPCRAARGRVVSAGLRQRHGALSGVLPARRAEPVRSGLVFSGSRLGHRRSPVG